MELKKVTKQQWLDALKSGEYKHGTGFLYDSRTDGFCCLGVLSDLAGYPKKLKAEIIDGMGMESDFDCKGFIPVKLREVTGISIEDQRDLARLNDRSTSFRQVIKYIETNIKDF